MTRHVIEIPEDIERALEQRASDAGTDVPRIIHTAIVAFIRKDSSVSQGRLPDPPLESPEILPPCDLPKTAPRAIPIQLTSHRDFPEHCQVRVEVRSVQPPADDASLDAT